MFTKTSSINEEHMGLKYYFPDVNNSDGFSPLYANSGVSYYKTNYYPSRPPSSEIPVMKIYNDIIPSTHLQKKIYANVSVLSSNPTDISSESSYTTSITFPSDINIVLDENNNRVYENIKLRPESSSLPIYMNLEHQKDLPTLPVKTNQYKQVQNVSIDHETKILETSIIQVSLITLTNTNIWNVNLFNIFRRLKNLKLIWPRIVVIKVFYIVQKFLHKFVEHHIVLDDIVDVVQHIFVQFSSDAANNNNIHYIKLLR